MASGKLQVLMLLGYGPQFGLAFARAAALTCEVITLQEVPVLSGPSLPEARHLRRRSGTEYELLMPTRRPSWLWHNPRIPAYGSRFERAFSALESEHGDFDLIHGHFYSSVLNALKVPRPVVVSEHSSVFARGESPAVMRSRRLAREVYRRTSLALPVSEHQGELMRKAGIEKEMRVVHNPVDPALFMFSRPRRRSARTELMSACRLAPTKNLFNVIHAVRLLIDRGFELQWRVFGEGPESAHLRQSVEDLGIANRVTFEGFTSQGRVHAAMNSSDIYVMGSTVESFGLPTVEALMSGLPVVATPVGVVPELSGLASMTITSGYEATDLAAAIERAIRAYPSAEERLGVARSVAADFSPESISSSLREAYVAALEAADV